MMIERREIIPATEVGLSSLYQETADWFSSYPLACTFCFGVAYFLAIGDPRSQLELDHQQHRLSAEIFLGEEPDNRKVKIGTERGYFLFRGNTFGGLRWCRVEQDSLRDVLVIETTAGEFRFARERGVSDIGVTFEAREESRFSSFTLSWKK